VSHYPASIHGTFGIGEAFPQCLLHPACLFDETDGQVTRVSGHFLPQRDQLIHIPLRPHKSPVEELRFWTGEPNSEVAWQFLWKILSLALISTGLSILLE
jgi:hypothetical protein